MPIETNETPEVAPKASGYNHAQAGHVSMPGEGSSGVFRSGAGLFREPRKPREDVHLIVGQAVRAMEKLRARHSARTNSEVSDENGNFWVGQLEKDLQSIRDSHVAMGETQEGQNEISRRLEDYRNSILGQAYGAYEVRAAKQFDANTQAMLGNVYGRLEGTNDWDALKSGFEEIESIAGDYALRFTLSDAQHDALKRQYMQDAITHTMNAAIARGNYEEARALEARLVHEYPDILGKAAGIEAGGDSVTMEDGANWGVSGASGFGQKIRAAVEGLRQRESAQDIIIGAKKELKIGDNSVYNILFNKRSGKEYDALMAKAKRAGITEDALRGASIHLRNARLQNLEILAKERFSTAYENFNRQLDANGGEYSPDFWEQPGAFVVPGGAGTMSPREYYEKLRREFERTRDYSLAATAQKIWMLYHQKMPGPKETGSGPLIHPGAAEWEIRRQKLMAGTGVVSPEEIRDIQEKINTGVYPPESWNEFQAVVTKRGQESHDSVFPSASAADGMMEETFQGMERATGDDLREAMMALNPNDKTDLPLKDTAFYKNMRLRVGAFVRSRSGQATRAEVQAIINNEFAKLFAGYVVGMKEKNASFFHFGSDETPKNLTPNLEQALGDVKRTGFMIKPDVWFDEKKQLRPIGEILDNAAVTFPGDPEIMAEVNRQYDQFRNHGVTSKQLSSLSQSEINLSDALEGFRSFDVEKAQDSMSKRMYHGRVFNELDAAQKQKVNEAIGKNIRRLREVAGMEDE